MTLLIDDVRRDAQMSADGRYRYLLSRSWSDAPHAIFVMLNPSTADHLVDDRTIGRCMGFARRWHCGGITVANLFAYRATRPAVMARAADPVGPETDAILAHLAERADARNCPVIAAWGAHKLSAGRAARVFKLFGRMQALAVNQDGSPKHPLYVKGNAQRLDWAPPSFGISS